MKPLKPYQKVGLVILWLTTFGFVIFMGLGITESFLHERTLVGKGATIFVGILLIGLCYSGLPTFIRHMRMILE